MNEVIIIGMNYSIALGAIRSLGEAGYGVRFIGFNKNTVSIAGRSKYVSRSVLSSLDAERLFQAMESLRGEGEKLLVLSLNDRCCRMLDQNYDRLSEHFYLANIDGRQGAISDHMNKMIQKKMADECGLATAKGNMYFTSPEGMEAAVGEIQYPCFLKPVVSAEINNSKSSFALCHNSDELRKAMKKANEWGGKQVLIEEYLNIDEELCLYGVAGNGKVYIPGCVETLRGGLSSHKGVTMEGRVVSANSFSDETEKVKTLVKNMNLTGLFCVDLLRCGDRIYFSEINLRGGGSGYAITLAGANLFGTFADMIYNGSDSGPDDVKKSIRFLNEKVIFDAYLQGYVKRREYKKYTSDQTERFVENSADPEPWKMYNKRKIYYFFRLKVLNMIMKPLSKGHQKVRAGNR